MSRRHRASRFRPGPVGRALPYGWSSGVLSQARGRRPS
ncbi:hypothetical protein PCLA_01r0445 [Pseudomonas citronellolis]|nr:hypothetical protein PCLA_01r0445 [Pseudomonas citronellolis]